MAKKKTGLDGWGDEIVAEVEAIDASIKTAPPTPKVAREQLTVRLPTDLIDRIDARVAEIKRSQRRSYARSHWIEAALEAYLAGDSATAD